MSKIMIGNTAIDKFYYGDNLVDKVYRGTELLYEMSKETDVVKWETLAPFPKTISRHAAVAFNGKLWVIGGGTSTVATKEVHIYNPTTNTWTEGPALPEPRSRHIACVCGDKIFVMGGGPSTGVVGNATTTLYCYTEASGWTTKAPIPVKSLKLLLGETYASGFYMYQSSSTANTSTYYYNISKNAWETRRDIPINTVDASLCRAKSGGITVVGGPNEKRTIRYHVSATSNPDGKEMPYQSGGYLKSVTMGEEIYVSGGELDTGRSFYAYSRVDDTWRKKASLPRNMNLHSMTELNGTIYIVGGADPISGTQFTGVYGYTPEQLFPGRWRETSLALKYRQKEPAVTVDGDCVYLIGGGYRQTGCSNIRYNLVTGETKVLAKHAIASENINEGTVSAMVNGKIYVARPYSNNGTWTYHLFCYDITKDTWSELRSCPEHVTNLVAIDDRYLYATPGWSPNDTHHDYGTHFYRYDIQANSWTKLPNLPAEMYRIKPVQYGRRIYYFSKPHTDSKTYVYFYYDGDTGKFSETKPFPRFFQDTPAPCVFGDEIYFIGSENPLDADKYGDLVVGRVLVFNPKTDIWSHKSYTPYDTGIGIAIPRDNHILFNPQGKGWYKFTPCEGEIPTP